MPYKFLCAKISIKLYIFRRRKMTKKTAIILSIICFMLLVVLIVLEKKYPEAGYDLIHGLAVYRG